MATRQRQELSKAKLALLEQRLRNRPAFPQRAAQPVRRRLGSGPAPMSLEQEQLWSLLQLLPGKPVFNETVTISKDGSFDAAAFRWAFNEMVSRHEIWRTTFTLVSGQPVQVIKPPPYYDLPILDLSHLPEAERECEAIRVAAEDARLPYELDRGPLIRPRLVRLTSAHHRLYLAMHQLVFDGWSVQRVVLPELTALYQAAATGRSPQLEEPPVQYADYATWQRGSGTSTETATRIEYWRNRLSRVTPTLQLPFDRTRPATHTFQGGMESVFVSAAATERLRAVARRSGVTFFQVVAATFAVLLHRYSGRDDLLFATVADLRNQPELEKMVGYCVSPLVVRSDGSDNPTFLELLRRIQDDLLEGLSNLVPFEQLLRALRPRRDKRANPIFQDMVLFEPPTLARDVSWTSNLVDAEIGNLVGNARLDLQAELDERPEGYVRGRLIYNSDLFEAITVRRMARHWETLLESVAADPKRRISELPMLTDVERRQQLVDWNATKAEYSGRFCLHGLVTAQAKQTPDAVAVVGEGQQLTFRELEHRANGLAHRLQLTGVVPRDRVVICVESSLDVIVGLLAILKAGAAYVALDPSSQLDWLGPVMSDSGARVLLTHSHLRSVLPEHEADVLCIDDAVREEPVDEALPATVTHDDLACVIYTSDSEGWPLGVAVRHQGAVNYLKSIAEEPGIGPEDTLLAITPCSFDLSITELWLPLITGARLFVASRKDSLDCNRLGRLIAESGTTFVQATPTIWQTLIEAGWAGSPGLVALCTREPLTSVLAEQLLDRCRAVWNIYGSPEVTVGATLARVERGTTITIGRPLTNTRIYILDRSLQPIPLGVPGELFVSGDGVSPEYLGRPGLTAEHFLEDPFLPAARMHATGDLARFLPDGRIELLGRLDEQVILPGFLNARATLEGALVAHPNVQSAAVLVRKESTGDGRLVAYVVLGEGAVLSDLGAWLRERFPELSAQTTFNHLERLPLTPDGRVDRALLPALQAGRPRQASGYVAPRTIEEKAIAGIWRQLLGVERVGVHDDFFELGGHSSLVLRMLAEVERHLGSRITLDAIFGGGSTIAGLSSALRAGGPGASAGPLVVSAPSAGSRPILFFVAPGERDLVALRHFVSVLGADQPLVGLVTPLQNYRFDRSGNVGQLADAVLSTIRINQSRGPYCLCGHSMGGLVVYEIARKLRSHGEEVHWLGLLDTLAPSVVPTFVRRRRDLRARLRNLIGRLRQQGPRGVSAELWRLTVRRAEWLRALLGLPLQPHQFDYAGAGVLAMRHRLVGHDVPVDLFVTSFASWAANSPTLGWETLHGGPLHCHEFEGDHGSLLREPNVTRLLEIIEGRLGDDGSKVNDLPTQL